MNELIIFIVVILVIFIIIKFIIGGAITSSESITKKSDYTYSDDSNSIKNVSKEELLKSLPKEIKDKILSDDNEQKLLDGDVTLTKSVTKKVIKYNNGEKISEKVTSTNDILNSKKVITCPNCGASIDSDSEECSYCNTKLN